MSGTPIDEFQASLSDLDVTSSRTTADAFRGDIIDAIVKPAVGVRLPWPDVSLAETPINVEPTAGDLRTAKTGVTSVAFGIAEYGTLSIGSSPNGDEPVSLYPERHVAVVAASDVVPDMNAAFARLSERFRDGDTSFVFETGPSATADMGALVRGVHGPEDVHVVVITDR
ncbi:LUD domain-containing protein [Haladaptatus sp. DFWS20]|uniref:LUD domain-containing protein n=1 Tax=Haladaptatus sp. DFWS20 TaxID=3403467 RepID=UPI003EC0D0A2